MDNCKYADAAPCSVNDSSTLKGLGGYKYEFKHDGSERGFNSILDLRRDKVLNHLSVAEFAGTRHFFPYRFEDLKVNGTLALLNDMEDATGYKAKCQPIFGKEEPAEGDESSQPVAQGRRHLEPKVISPKRVLPREYIEYMNKFVDWEVESKIGYYPRQPL